MTIYSETPPKLLRKLGTIEVSPEPAEYEIETYLLAGETIWPDAARLFRSRPPTGWHNPLAQTDGQPGVAYRWLEVEGPFIDQWPTPGTGCCLPSCRSGKRDTKPSRWYRSIRGPMPSGCCGRF